MKPVDKKQKLKRDGIKARIKSGAGFSFVELLVTILILSLASGGMARGVVFAREQYRKSMVLSESKTLCSTLSDVIKDELRNATEIADDHGTPVFNSYGYTGKNSRFYALDGEIWIGDPSYDTTAPDYSKHNKRLISKAAYSAYHLRAKVTVTHESQSDSFHVELIIQDADRNSDIVESKFDVFPLNP